MMPYMVTPSTITTIITQFHLDGSKWSCMDHPGGEVGWNFMQNCSEEKHVGEVEQRALVLSDGQ